MYEGKLSQYKKYYSLTDSYSENSRKALFSSFQDGMLELIRNPSEDNTLKYIKSIFARQGDVSDQFLTFKNEISGLRLEAGEKLLSLLDEYIDILEKTENKTVEFLTLMNSNAAEFINAPDETNAHVQKFMKEEFSGFEGRLQEIQDKMLKEMRRELCII